MGEVVLTGTITAEGRDHVTGLPYLVIEHRGVTYRCDERARGTQLFTLRVGGQVNFRPAAAPNGGSGYAAWVGIVPLVRPNPPEDSGSSLFVRNDHPSAQLFNWAHFPTFSTLIADLKKLALPECWIYGATDVLDNYLRYTFDRLQLEKKLCTREECAAFNTGLVDEKYEYIHMFFNKNSRIHPEWRFAGFAVAGERGLGKVILQNFNPLPAKAEFFEDISECIYDMTLGPPICDYEHILIERLDRLPEAFLIENCPQGFSLLPGAALEDLGREGLRAYYENLRTAYRKDDKMTRRLKSRLNDAVALAMRKAEWNYRVAVPIYFPLKKKISLLLPLALVDDDVVDMALVVEKADSGVYIGNTVLTLEKAYNDARLIARPDSGWLTAG